jgi:hypothetical protein
VSGAAIPFGRMSLHVSKGSRAECFIFEDDLPILDISAGSALVAVCFAGDVADDEAMAFARELVRSAEQKSRPTRVGRPEDMQGGAAGAGTSGRPWFLSQGQQPQQRS